MLHQERRREMNLLNAMVIEVMEPFRHDYGTGNSRWFTPVRYECYGHEGRTDLVFDTEEEALSVKIGDEIFV